MSTTDYIFKKYNLAPQPAPIEIPNAGRIDLVRLFRELDFKKGAEIGVDHADFSKLIVENNSQLTLFGIDPWLKYDEYREYTSQEQMDGIYEYAKSKMFNYIKDGRYRIIREKSMDALKFFEDGSLDFVYIDGNHEGNYPYEDIVEWAKKIRKGGIISGHDYVRIRALDFTIKDALEKYTKENNIETWFVLGRSEIKAGEIRDRVRSWIIVR